MATKIRHKRSSVAGKKPTVGQLESGELALNTADGKVFLKRDDNTVQDITQRIFENNTQVRVDDANDSSQGVVSIEVDGDEKVRIVNAQIELKDTVEITNANSLIFKELIASGNDGVNIKAPDTLDASYNLTLPPAVGIPGELLRLGSSGQLLFENADVFGGNTVYVSSERGDDSYDGINLPVKTIKRACQIASGLVYNPDSTINGTRVNIKVAVGDYTEQNPIIVPDNVIIKGDGLRGCIVRPANANLDMLRVRNGSYFAEFTFRDKVDSNFVPLFTFDYAVSFDDPDDVVASRAGYTYLPTTRPTITTSPYIQNCSIISFLGGNGAKIDGSKVSSPNTSVIQIESENPVIGAAPEQGKSMVSNAFTMLSFGGTGWRLVNDAYAQIVSCFQIFMLNGVYCQSGGYCSITNSATNFGLYALRSTGYSPRAYSFDRGYVVNTGVAQSKQTLTVIGINRQEPVNEFVIRFREPEYKIAYDLIESEKNTLADDTLDWMDLQIATATPSSIWYNFSYVRANFRPTLLVIIDAVAKDAWGTGNSLVRQVALSFYSNRLADSSNITISGQEEQVKAALEQLSVYTNTVIASLDSEVRTFVDGKYDLIIQAIGDPDSIPDAVDVTSQGDITNNYKTIPSETTFNAATAVNSTTDIFTIASHGFTNRQAIIYSSNGNPVIGGLDEDQTYYVNLINSSEFTLTFDESGDFPVNITAASTGVHKFVSNVREFYVVDILSSHTTYQRLILESGAESYEFIPGRAITGTTGASNNSAYVYSWKPADRELIVSIEEVTVGITTQRNQFTVASIITEDHAFIPNTTISINEVGSISTLSTSTFTLEGTVTGALLTNLVNLLEKQIWLHRPSIVNSSSHTWEYAGSGTDYNALPQNGGNTKEEFEQFEELPGRVYTSGTNELGDFKVGDFITAFNRTGNITFRNKVTVEELDVLRLALSDIVIEEISTDVNLGDTELGGPANTRLSTQLAIRSFLSNRLGGFIDKSVSTAAVPGAIVQLNSNGQLNAELIPATRTFTNTDNDGYLSRLTVVDEIPAVDLKGGDIATENYEQIELTFASGVTASDGDVVLQAVTGATGYVKGDYTSSTNILVASIGLAFKEGDDSTGTDFDTTNIISIDGVSTGQAPTVLGTSAGIIENFFLKSSNSSQYLVISNGNNFTFTVADISTVARNTNIATIVTTTDHNLNPGNNVQIICSDTIFSANTTVISTPTSSSFTYSNTGTDVGTVGATGSVRTIVTSADGNAQGAVTETRFGVLTNVDNANIVGGSNYTPASGSIVYENVPLNTITGSGSGAIADITVTAGQVTDVDLRRGGTGYAIGDLVGAEANYLGEDSAGTGFEIEVLAVENRAYVNILGGELFVATPTSVDYVEDNEAVNNTITITLTNTVSNNFLAGDIGSAGDVDYSTSRIIISGHGYTNGDPVTYNTLGNVAIGGLINGNVYYAKVINSSTLELYSNYNLLNKVTFTSTPANNNHNITRYQVNVTDNSLIVPAHGLSTGDAIKVTGNNLFSIAAVQVDSGERFFVGSITTNSFTLHSLRSEALSSINGLVTNAKNITATGSGTADIIEQNVQISNIVNTSSRIKSNWNSLAATNIDASNIISGVIDPSRLAATGVANTDTFLRGDSSYQTVVQSLKKANTTDNPIVLTGSSSSGEFYGDPVNIGIENADFAPAQLYSTLGVSRFLQSQFDVDVNGTGQVFIKNGVVDAGTLDGLDSSYFLNPANLTSTVPVNKGGTNLATYAVGDMIYAQSSGTLTTLTIGRNNSFLKSNGTNPEWSTALDLAEGLDVGSAKLSSSSVGIGTVYNENVTSIEIGSLAESVKIGRSTSGRNITAFCTSYDASISDIVTVNLTNFTRTTNGITANADNEVPLASTSNILFGMLVTGSASIPANTTVTGVTANYIYLSNNTTGTISSATTLTFTFTPLVLGIRAGDTVTIASSTITNLDGEWPVIGATANATSFTIQVDLNVTANPANPIAGTITKANTILFRNRNAIFGSSEASGTPVAATIKGESGVGTDIGGAEFIIQAGLGTGNATGGNFVVKTGQIGSSSDIEQIATTRLTIDTSGTATFSGIITANNTIQANAASGITTSQTTFPLINTTATTVNFAGASTALTIGATTGTATIRNANVVLNGDLEVQGGDLTTNQTVFNLLNATATTINIGSAATAISVGAGSGTTTVNHSLVVTGDLTVNGTTTTVNSTTISVDDKNIELGSVAVPTDITADGGGITLRGDSDKTIIWDNANDNWTSSEHWNVVSGKEFKINNVSVLNSTTLGSTVVTSSLTTVGTIGTGIWQGTIIDPTYGGTGVNNGTKTITLGGNFTHSGAHTLTLTTTGNTNVTLPTTGTLARSDVGLSQFASTTSAELAGVISDETGSGSLVFGTSPTFTTSIVAGSATMALFDTTATTINFAGAATTVEIGAATGTTSVNNDLTVDGNTTLGNANTDTVTLTGTSVLVPNTVTFTEDDATTNAVSYPISISHTTSGTPALGIGVGVQFITETSVSNNEIGATIEAVSTDVTATSEDFDLIFKTMAAGASASERLRISSSTSTFSGNVTLGTQTNKATVTYTTNTARTYTLPDAGADASFVMTEGNQTINGTKTFGSTISGSINGNANTATTLQTTRTLWGQNFNGSANVSGNLIDVGNITGTGSITITAGGVNQNIVLTPAGSGVVVVSSDLDVQGGDLTTNQTTFNLIDTTATTVNFAGAATTGNFGYDGTAASTTNISTGAVAAATTKTVNIGTGSAASSTTNINIGSNNGGTTIIASPNITVTGLADTSTAATHYYVETGSSNNLLPKALADVKTEIVTTAAVNAAAATTVGTITSGTWNGSIINPTYGGTGVNNGSNTITIGGNFTTSGAFTTTLTVTGNTNVTLPTTGTLARSDVGLNQFASTTSSQLAGVISDETGSGALVFGTSPTFTTSIIAGSATMALFNTTATQVNAFGDSSTLNLGYFGTSSSTTNISVGVAGAGATKTINIGTDGAASSTTNINIGSINGGTTIIASPNITVNGISDTATAASHYYVETGSTNNLVPKTLANVRTEIVTTAAVNAAAATTVGTVTSGTWNAGVIGPAYGGTGVANNAASTLTINGNFGTTFTISNTTNLTLPTSGTLATTGNLSQFASTTSAELAGVISDETGTGSLVFGTSPNFTTSINGGITFTAFANSSTLTLGYTGTAASTTDISTGAVASATTKTVNLGTGGAASSVTNINIGSTNGGTTTVNSPTLTTIGSVTVGTDLVPDTDNTGNVGTSALTFNNGWFTNFTVDGVLDVRDAIDLADNNILRFGTGDDWEFFHDGVNNYVDLNVGDMLIRDNTTTRFTFARTTGNFTATGEVTAYSDARLKDNVENIDNSLNKILQIRGVIFTRNDLEDKETKHMGVIAQEIENYFPELVHTTENGYKTVNYGAMAGAFIEAFKDQQKQIEELRHMVKQLLDK